MPIKYIGAKQLILAILCVGLSALGFPYRAYAMTTLLCQQDVDGDTVGYGSGSCYINTGCPIGYTAVMSGGASCPSTSWYENDNCPYASNSNQTDANHNGIGDICEGDKDADGVLDANDNCPINANLDQLNTDGDAQGNACDTDDDNDGVADTSDKFPLNSAEWSDNDNDSVGDNADTDDDNDSVPDMSDNCPLTVNTNQFDNEADGMGDVCDSDDDNDGLVDAVEVTTGTNPLLADTDGDIVNDHADNCPLTPNADQLDGNTNGRGDVCEAGALDNTFKPGAGFDNQVHSIAEQVDGKIIVGGVYSSIDGVARQRVARLNADGSLDSTFDPGSAVGYDRVDLVSLQTDGKVLLGVIGNFVARVIRLNTDGSLDGSFYAGSGFDHSTWDADITAMLVQSDGKIIVTGVFNTVAGVIKNNIVRLNADGSLDNSFNSGSGANYAISAMAEQSDGKIIIGGSFTSYDGSTINRIARLNADGSLDASFNLGGGANNSVSVVSVQAGGKIVIGGAFTSYNGSLINRMARLNADGSLDTSFDPGTWVDGFSNIAVQVDGKILISGYFTSISGITRNRIARLNASGSLDLGFNPGTGANSVIFGMALQRDGKIVIGGDFGAYDGQARLRIARIHSGDTDNDSIEDAADNCTSSVNTDQLNTDGDAQGNACDSDDDNDGVIDINDAFPFDPTESKDTDNDGIGNNTDWDDDGDDVPDAVDAAPLDNSNTNEIILPLDGIYKGGEMRQGITQ